MSGDNQQDDKSDLQRRIAEPGNGTPYSDDEISLFDIWDALVRRRWIIIGITAFFTILAIAFALVNTKSYGYRTTIQIGSYVPANKNNNGSRQLLEPINDAKNQLVNAYVPAARQTLVKHNKKLAKKNKSPPKVNVETKQGQRNNSVSSVLVLHTKAPAGKADLVKQLHKNILSRLKQHDKNILQPIKARRQDHLKNTKYRLKFYKRDAIKNSKLKPIKQKIKQNKRVISGLKTTLAAKKLKLNNKISNQKRNIEQIKDNRSQLKSRLNNLNVKKRLTKNQLESRQNLVSRLEKASGKASMNIKAPADALTILTFGAQINKARNRIDNLQKRLQVQLPQKRKTLNEKLKSNARSQQKATDQLKTLKNNLTQLKKRYKRKIANAKQNLAAAQTNLATAKANYNNEVEKRQNAVENAKISLQQESNTHALAVASRSIKPVSTGKKTIVVLGFILGLMFSLFVALMAEFAASARDRRLAANGE